MKVELLIKTVVTTKIAILMFHNLHNPHIILYNFSAYEK
jgi:hypothetical protein